MQTLKEDINNRIKSAALIEFERCGYSRSSMRQIAAEAGVTVGNIYRYYGSKDELFRTLIQPTYLHFTNLLLMIQRQIDLGLADGGGLRKMELVDDTFNRLIQLLEESSRETKILFTLSQGSSFEHAKQELTDIIAQIFESIIYQGQGSGGEKESLTVRILAATMTEGVCITLQNVRERDQIRHSFVELANLFGAGLKQLSMR